MVAKITTPHSILRVLNYNENKVQKGFAECIYAGNFLKEVEELSFYEKFFFFKHRTELNQRAKTNMLHISLNFHPSEKLPPEKLQNIATSYLEKIGFAKQPFLVYKHLDAGHPHLHIITTSILADGKRIDTFNIGRNASEKARKEIEREYMLVKAEGRNTSKESFIGAFNLQRIKYGKTETKRSIINVLETVLKNYKYTSLPELNAILKLFNVIADRGNENGRIYKNNGLVYRILDSDFQKIGVPVKASSIYFNPTLSFLEEKFKINKELRSPFIPKLKNAIDFVFIKKINSIEAFTREIQKEKIHTILHRNDTGFLYGITYVDHRTGCVFKGSDLGKKYTASGIKQRLCSEGSSLKSAHQKITLNPYSDDVKTNLSHGVKNINQKEDLIQILLNRQSIESRFPIEFLRKKKKRRKHS